MKLPRLSFFLITVICLVAYLCMAIGNTALAVAIAPIFAGAHEVLITADQEHTDIVFGHSNLAHREHHHESSEKGLHAGHQDRLSAAHSHPDHKFHLLSSKKDSSVLSSRAPKFLELHDVQSIPAHPLLVSMPLGEVRPIQRLAKPPPLPKQSLCFLKTIILLI
jgi:hypothetical protein